MAEWPWAWADCDLDGCWEEIRRAWQSKALRDTLTKDSAPKDFQEGEDEDAIRRTQLPWHSIGSIWVEGEQP